MDGPLARDAFDRLADGYDEQGASKPANAYLERPATLSLLPEVDGESVLDAGCGAGHLMQELSERGGRVLGMDVSASMLARARQRVPTAQLFQADLASGLPLQDATVDGVVSSLAFHYIPEWRPLFAELHRVLRPSGWVVFSVQHPFADFLEYSGATNYHERERVEADWDSFGEAVTVPAYRRPLGQMVGPILDAGFTLEALLEPTPTEAYRDADPERYAYESTHPNFLCLRARRS
jgi:ubiquinone/menaquinone biosynthesis C-methylase UbiE